MRTYIWSGIAVAIGSGLAFFAGTHVGSAQAAPPRPVAEACAAAPAIAATERAVESQQATSPSRSGDGAPEDAGKPTHPAARDERQWPHQAWPSEDAAGLRLFSKVRFLWIRPEPKRSNKWLGYLSLGDSIRLKGGDKETAFAGKSHSVHCHSWYAVEPRGYVCVNEDKAGFDGNDADIKELVARRADRMKPWPYQYGESTGTPVYQGIPPTHRQRRNESRLEDHLARVRQARSAKSDKERVAIDPMFEGVDLQLTGKEPPRLIDLGPRGRTNKHKIVRGSTLGFTDAFDVDGRSWVMTWDRGVVPRDRVKLYPQSTFEGVALDDKVRLPIAFFRKAQAQYRRDGDTLVATGADWPRHGHVMVTDERIEHDGKSYLVSKQDGLLVGVDNVSVARRSHEIPPQIRAYKKGRRTWVDVSVLRGWLVAYEYDKPVYATMVSPGRGGVPKHGVDPLETASTPVGRFRITGKFVTATMVSNASKDVVHDEVMYTQNFTGPYALHGAYWHDEWGVGKSGGCVNLAPIDARRLFKWSEPQLPAGWHAVQLVTGYAGAKEEYDRATLVYVHK